MKRDLIPLLLVCSVCVACERSSTVQERIRQFGPAVDLRLRPLFQTQGVSYPPPALTLLCLKEEKKVELYALGTNSTYRLIKTYPILAASGKAGPKLKEGDLQVPEGFYAIESLNPNSLFHLSLRVNYPNEEDRKQAKEEGRTQLGGDIMIHGRAASIGCIALGDPASEELFVLAEKTGLKRIRVLIAPLDFRARPLSDVKTEVPAWVPPLYERLKKEMETRYPIQGIR